MLRLDRRATARWTRQPRPADGDLELEEEDEHGGDVNDEPHDPDTDAEPMLGWTEHVDQKKAGERDPAVWGSFNDDMEPSLGAPENPHDQRRWVEGRPQEVNYRPSGRPANRYPDAPDQAARKALHDLRKIRPAPRRQCPAAVDGLPVTMSVE